MDISFVIVVLFFYLFVGAVNGCYHLAFYNQWHPRASHWHILGWVLLWPVYWIVLTIRTEREKRRDQK